MAKIEQTGRGKSVESKLDAQPERSHFATLRGLVRYRLQKLMRANVRWVKKPHLGKARFWQRQTGHSTNRACRPSANRRHLKLGLI
jgi:hypothetical protein